MTKPILNTTTVLPEGCRLAKMFGRVSSCDGHKSDGRIVRNAEEKLQTGCAEKYPEANMIIGVTETVSLENFYENIGTYSHSSTLEGTAVRIQGPGFDDPA